MKKTIIIIIIIILLFLSSCSFPQLTSKEEGLNKLVVGWWERFHPEDNLSNHSSVLTHIEFMSDGECRFNIVYFEGDESYNTTYNSHSWEIDSVISSDILLKSFSGGFHPDFSISVIKINKSILLFRLNFQEFTETVYMKRLSKLQ